MPVDLVKDRIHRAALQVAATYGITKFAMGDVARIAGLSRQTLYKHFPSKSDLVMATVAREATGLIDEVQRAADEVEDVQGALEAGIATALRLTREHPLLDRIISSEPEVLVPLLVLEDSPVLGAVRGVVETSMMQRMPELDDIGRRRTVDLLARLLISFAITAPDDPPEVVAEYVAVVVFQGTLALAGAPWDREEIA